MTFFLYKRLTLGLVACWLLTLAVASGFPRCFPTPGRSRESAAAAALLEEAPITCEGDTPEGLIRNFVSQSKTSLEQFHIHGWRWHTLSLVRESGRLRNLASKSTTQDGESLKEAADYVIGFNLRGLHAIETDLFFPWMKQSLVSVPDRDLSSAFETVMNQLDENRKIVAHLGDSITRSVSLVCDATKSTQIRSDAIKHVVEDATALEGCARSMMELEDSLLVPSVARVVPESEQKAFNDKVVKKLGLFESRLHLVGMHEAVQESQNPQEKALFERDIPYIPQMMIPRWKRKLYEPRTSVFE
mmetsp:Transcript_25838/g.39649  ORF Transcript_25838/g.39649 Transcript_25838/m.39649 type:complete len:302 (+) Transcript_25838:117-1022(+)